MDPEPKVLAAWVECMAPVGGPSQVLPGYSLIGRSVQEVTGMSYRRWRRKHE